jgi:hypothetical protein
MECQLILYGIRLKGPVEHPEEACGLLAIEIVVYVHSSIRFHSWYA